MPEEQNPMPLATQTSSTQRSKPVRILRGSVYVLFLLTVFATGFLSMGLAIFTGYAMLATEKMPDPADAIVVVTGGAGRLERAVSLFQSGKGKKLFISGVHPRYTDRTLAARYKLSEKQIECCVDLDPEALNTAANATQTAIWAKENGFKSLIIVTSSYHMPRTMLEMYRAAPDIKFQGDLVSNPGDRAFLERMVDWRSMRLLTKEYGKLLAAIVHASSEKLKSSAK